MPAVRVELRRHLHSNSKARTRPDSRFAELAKRRGTTRSTRRSHARLRDAFPEGARLIEFCGGTGEDALWLAARGRQVLMTDASLSNDPRRHRSRVTAGSGLPLPMPRIWANSSII